MWISMSFVSKTEINDPANNALYLANIDDLEMDPRIKRM